MANATVKYADDALIQRARDLYQSDDVEIDDLEVEVSRADEDHGTWVAAWVWVPDEEAQDG